MRKALSGGCGTCLYQVEYKLRLISSDSSDSVMPNGAEQAVSKQQSGLKISA